MSKFEHILFLFAFFAFSSTQGHDVNYMSALSDTEAGLVKLVPGKQPGAVAWGSFLDTIHQDGWSYLELKTNPKYDDEIAAYAAGALEGALSRNLMKSHLSNMFDAYCTNNTAFCERATEYFTKQLDWLHERSLAERSRSSFWNQLYLILKELAGLDDAYNNRTLSPANNYTVVTFIYFLNNEGALHELETALGRIPDEASLNSVTPCSLLVKTTSNDFLLGHATWTVYRSMLRVQKKYMLQYRVYKDSDERVPGHTISMSSYPGKLNSVDDFYIVSTGLAVSETTNDVFNTTLFAYMANVSVVPTDFRVMVANRLAKDGKHWTRTFKKHNSGTYNNQWIIIDYNKINISSNGVVFSEGTFWMLEQLPTLVVSQDMTDIFKEQGYWASYNVPYFPAIYDESGYADLYRKHGDRYSHDNCSRAKIFRRDHNNVVDPASMLTILRYNDYTRDPLSKCNCTPPYSPVETIAARYDLLDEDGRYDDPDQKMRADGAIDAKVADYRSIRDFSFTAVSGPTNDVQPTFVWSQSKFNNKPVGHPDAFDFKPVRHRWNL